MYADVVSFVGTGDGLVLTLLATYDLTNINIYKFQVDILVHNQDKKKSIWIYFLMLKI